jgi:DNA-binding NtrC family response regulator
MPFEGALLDHQLPDGDGLDLLGKLKQANPSSPVIMMTALSDNGLAIESIRQGAYDFIRKPMDPVELDAMLDSALRARSQSRGAVEIEGEPISINGIVGCSRAIVDVCKAIGRVATADATVLITGESGTGKEVVAKALHYHSQRAGAFVPVNCSAIVETLLESELFGHEKGSFTGAAGLKQGRFELASEGTLFLDEIGEMAPALQAKLLRILQERRFERVGGEQSIRASARVVAATHRDLAVMVREGTFREDLYYRLNVVTLHLPPLRERIEDLPPLVEHLLRKSNRDLYKNVTRISSAAWAKLKEYHWPGNIRELENVITRAVVLARSDVLTPDLLVLGEVACAAPADSESEDAVDMMTLDQLEERHVRAVLDYTRWHKGRSCAILGISRPALDRKISKYGIE